MAAVKFTARQRDHMVPTLVCAIQFTLGTTCLTVNVSNLCIATHSSLSCSSLCIRRNLCIAARSSLSYPLVSICCNLRIITRISLNSPPIGIRHNLRIATRNSLSYPSANIRCTLLLRLSSMPLLGKMVPTDARVLQKGLFFLFVHWFNEDCSVEGKGDK
jgi:hypothetical protein